MDYEGIKNMLDNEGWLSKENIEGNMIKRNKEYILNFFKNEGWIKGSNI